MNEVHKGKVTLDAHCRRAFTQDQSFTSVYEKCKGKKKVVAGGAVTASELLVTQADFTIVGRSIVTRISL